MSVVTLILAAIAGFTVFWAGVVSLIGFAGWKPLADRYPAERWPEGEGRRMSWQSARVGLSNYNGALNAVVTAEGLYLRPVRIFAYNHPPIFVPWSAVARTEPRWLSGVVLELDEGGRIALSGRLGKEVQRAVDAWEAGASPASGRLDLGDGLPEAEPPQAGSWRRRRTR